MVYPTIKRSASHLLTLQNITNKIIHEGEPLYKFENDYLREPFFNWNPPSCNTLTAVCKDNVDDKYDMDKHVISTQNDNDNIDEVNSQADHDTGRPDGEVPRVIDDINRDDTNGHDMDAHVPNDHMIMKYDREMWCYLTIHLPNTLSTVIPLPIVSTHWTAIAVFP